MFNSKRFFLIISALLLSGFGLVNAADSLCASVKMEINQELSLERQAFDAHMRINNGLSQVTLTNVGVIISFKDKDGNIVIGSTNPNDLTAKFFITEPTLENIDSVAGSGTINPSTSADIHWLLIPANGSSNQDPQGTLYYIGATLTYKIGGEDHVTEVTPDYIYVKPLPKLMLDYFLPSEVYGDDAFNIAVEPAIPFAVAPAGAPCCFHRQERQRPM